jgi:hypothetical protein
MANLLSTNVTGTLNSTGNTTAAGFTGNANVGGTGAATWHPSGIYSGGTQWLYGTTYRNNATTSGQGQMYFDGNYGYGMVGLYSDVRYQAVFAMGDSYKLPVNGTTTGSLYGIAWTHTNIGGESKAGLGHQALFMMNGRTYTAIGSGIWTDGTITTTSHGTSANWNTAYGWGNHASAGYQAASTAITTSNIGSQSVNYATSAGNADTVDGFHATNAASGLAYYASNGYLNVPSWINVGTTGIFSGTNNAHLRPNTGSYGAWEMIGSKNGWSGIYFNDSGDYLMANNNEVGHYQNGVGWKFRWYQGQMYVSRNNTGGGTEYTVLDSGNYSSWAIARGGDTVTSIINFQTNNGGRLGATDSAKLQAYSTGNNAAFMSFHKAGHFAINFGIDDDNVMRIGGWSAAANLFQMDMSGNLTMKGDVIAFSDERVKENIRTLDSALEKTLKLRGVSYTRTDSSDKSTKIGVIAQEILEVVPEVVSQDANGTYGVSYGNIVGLLIEAIKEQQQQIDELKKRVGE